jgi:hypothetical protein
LHEEKRPVNIVITFFYLLKEGTHLWQPYFMSPHCCSSLQCSKTSISSCSCEFCIMQFY